MNIEDIARSFINFDDIHRRAEVSLNNDRIKIDDFVELYGAEQVGDDKEEVGRLDQKFKESSSSEEENAKKFATIFEAIFNEQAELSEWLGPNVITVCASTYDDYKNGIDTIAEINKEGRGVSHVGLAIDATYSSNTTSKFERIKKNINSGNLATIKYFSSVKQDFMGQLKQVPRVVIGADIETIKELTELWVNKKTKELSEHPIQFQILDLIVIQLEYFKSHAEKNGNTNLVTKFNNFIEIFDEIMADRMLTIENNTKRDKIFYQILDNVKNVFEK